MKKGTAVRIKATGITGIVADSNSKIVNVTIDEQHLAPGDDKQAYLTHDEVEEVTEVVETAKEETTAATETQTEAPKVEQTPATEGANFLQQLVESLQAQVKQLEAENAELKSKIPAPAAE